MKKLMLLLICALAVACSNDPVFHGLTQKEKETYAQSIAGVYPGRYEILYTDAQGQPADDDKLRRKTVSDVTISVSDLTNHSIIFNDFPLSLLAQVVDNAELSQALSTMPDMGLTGSYEFQNSARQSHVDWNFDVNPIALSLNYGGKKHNITVQFRNPYTFVELSKGQLDGGTAFEQGAVVQVEVSDIYDGDRLLHDFNGWGSDDRMLLAQFYFGLK